ncbi:hypothetical protein A7X84_12920 [Stenotrophomonas maltophilia]|uniref:hypothetical protein n=1 Tax=Stenotrophomonas TaxID=40323 RepID=UPI00066ED99E|nr:MULTISPECIES: hypothetical protein [Stenotrophomonas maltophilia group]ELK6804330.1 hypothetical protein [Stenotrophomonas maltophilia]MBA0401989.1 hypothetical protein [Stenotrophomonas maltophilia]MCU1133792.1 hypothetical protein [Stenotrophomonas maltophilia]MCU1194387.1 hypothetical protein [Stenotrophomonas maltophilia]MDT3433012.1 hypothetical protein [Stenotrophomonas maltophilia]
MSFRQFPAIDSNGESHVIIEFKPEANGSGHHSEATPRYELDDGRQLVRNGREFTTSGGELRLTI